MFDMTGLKANTVVTLAGDVTFTGGEFKDGILFSIDVSPRPLPPTYALKRLPPANDLRSP